MTYATARAKVVSLLEGATPTVSYGGAGAKFKEVPDVDEEHPPAGARAFALFGLGDFVRTPLLARGERHRVARLELRVYYRALANRQQLDLMLRADHKVISDRLIDPRLWDSSTSGICSVEQQGGSLIMQADVERRGELVVHVYRFDLEYLSGA